MLDIPRDKIKVMPKTLFTDEETRILIANAGQDADSGMEYLYGLEYIDPLGNKFYKKEDIERFINR